MASAIDTSELRRLANKMRGAGRQRVRSAMARALGKAATPIVAAAKQAAPVKFGALGDGIHKELNAPALMVKILTGDLASAYAELQHERGDYAHTLAAWRAKIFPSRRKPPKRGYQGGRAHFIYGRADSPFESNHPGTMAYLQAEAHKALRELVRS